MCGIVIRIRDNQNVTESKNTLIAMLEDILGNEISEIKKRKLVEKYSMMMTTELERRIDDMCSLSTVVEENAVMETLISLVKKKKLTIEEAAEEAKMTVEKFVFEMEKRN